MSNVFKQPTFCWVLEIVLIIPYRKTPKYNCGVWYVVNSEIIMLPGWINMWNGAQKALWQGIYSNTTTMTSYCYHNYCYYFWGRDYFLLYLYFYYLNNIYYYFSVLTNTFLFSSTFVCSLFRASVGSAHIFSHLVIWSMFRGYIWILEHWIMINDCI